MARKLSQTRTLVFFLGVVALAAVPACSCGGDDDPEQPDAGDVDAPDSDAALSTVTGMEIITFEFDGGPVDVPSDLSGLTIEAIVGSTRIPGVGLANGTFSIPDVPEVPYILNINGRMIATTERDHDLGFTTHGRPDTAPVTIDPTNLIFNVDQMTPFNGGRLELISASARNSFFSIEFDASNPPAIDDIALADMTVNVLDALIVDGPNLIADDQTFLTHQSSKLDLGGEAYLAITDVFEPAAFTMTDGVDTTLTGSFAAVAQDLSVTVDLRGSEIDALRGQLVVNEEFSEFQPNFTVASSPFGTDQGVNSFVGVADYFAPDFTDRTVTIDYGDPFPADWELYESFFGGFVSDVDPGAGLILGIGSVGSTKASGGFAGAPISVELTPPGAISADGANLSTGPQSVSSPTPTLAWNAPTVGTASYYVVSVREVVNDGRGSFLGSLRTTATTLDLPPGLLAVGGRYFFEVTAVTEPGYDHGAPFRANSPTNAIARVPTHILSIE